jgi:uncharacterized protein YjaZ
MGVIQTDKWLLKEYESPLAICERLKKLLPFETEEIYDYLHRMGMYRPVAGGKEEVECLRENNIWNKVQTEFKSLRKWLNGPDVPIFIFPSDSYNNKIQREYNGKTGLAFPNCIFLFVSKSNDIREINAVLTHEYHHVARLHALKKKEEENTLLDTIIMEGLAETAVAERHSEATHAPWVSYYTKREAVRLWQRYLSDNIDVKRKTKRHERLLNGGGLYPSMLGYCIGYHIVQDCVNHTSMKSKQLLNMSAEMILTLAPSFSDPVQH